MKAIVTGAAGFVGSRIATELLRTGWTVVGLDRISDYYEPKIKLRNLQKLERSVNFTAVLRDINEVDLELHLEGCDAIFHQAGQPGVRKSWGSDFQSYVQDNIMATQVLLEAVSNHAPSARVVYASSSSIYGNADVYPTSELTLPRPHSPYGVSKLAAEHLCALYAANRGIHVTALRYFTVYGPGQRPDMAFTRFCSAIERGDEITVYGSGNQIRDFTYVDDIVAANMAAASRDSIDYRVYNVAGGSSVSVNETIATLGRLSGKSPRVTHIGMVAGDVLRTGGTTELIARELGWSAKVDLERGLAAQLEWIRELDV